VEHEEPDGVEPDDLPAVHVLRLILRPRATAGFTIIFSRRQVSVQNLHALQRPVVAKLPVKKQFLAEQKLLRGGQQRVNQPLRTVSVVINHEKITYIS